MLNEWVWYFSVGGPSSLCHLFPTGCLQNCTIEGQGSCLMNHLRKETEQGKSKPHETSPIILSKWGLGSPCLYTLPHYDEDSVPQRVCLGTHIPVQLASSHMVNRLILPCTSAVCLISDFHSELEEKILSLDHGVREWKIVVQKNALLLFWYLSQREHQIKGTSFIS